MRCGVVGMHTCEREERTVDIECDKPEEECWCPDAYIENGFAVEYCKRHREVRCFVAFMTGMCGATGFMIMVYICGTRPNTIIAEGVVNDEA